MASESTGVHSRPRLCAANGSQLGPQKEQGTSDSAHIVLRYGDVEIHRSAHKHGIDDAAIRHAVEHALAIIELEPDADPPKVLAIGPDHAGNLLEVIWLELAGDLELVIHAMPLRTMFYDLLPRREEDTP